MKICVDLDDTLVESNIITDTIKYFDLDFKREDIKSWDMLELPDYCRKEIYRRFKLPEYMCNLNPCRNAVQTINKWVAQGHTIFCLTSRALTIEKETKEFVNNLFHEIKETFVVNGSKTKTLNELKPDLYFDDGPHYVLESINLGINTVMISNKHTPYNHSLRDSIQWIKKISDYKI